MGVQRLAVGSANGSFALQVCALVSVIAWSFWPSLRGGFVWDDVAYLLPQQEARQLTWESVRWAFSLDAAVAGHYHPLTWLSWMVDFAIGGGAEPQVFRATNLILHAMHCVLLCILFRQLFLAARLPVPSWAIVLAVLLYAVHPMRVESVAWITERRDVLSGVFYVAALIAHIAAGQSTSPMRWRVGTLLLLILCGLSKAWAITLLPVMWVLDAFLLRRIPPGAGFSGHLEWVRERWAFVMVSLVVAMLGVIAASRSGAMVGLDDLSVATRIQQAAFSWWYYLGATVWPMDLAPYYGWAGLNFSAWRSAAYLAGFIAVWPLLYVAGTGWSRAILMSLLAYTFIIFPVLGLAQSGPQLVADRYSYLAIIPFHVAAAAGMAWVATRFSRHTTFVLQALTIIGAFVLAGAARGYVPAFSDEVAFWSRIVEVNPTDITARHTRAKAYWVVGRKAEAIADLREADRLQPHTGESLVVLVDIHLAVGDFSAAAALVEEAKRRGLDQIRVLDLRSRLARAEGEPREALRLLREASTLAPDRAEVWFRSGMLARELGELEDALRDLDRAVSLQPLDPDYRVELAKTLIDAGDAARALQQLEAALIIATPDWEQRQDVEGWVRQISSQLGAQQ